MGYWLDDVMNGILKGLDGCGLVRLDRNNGVRLPDAQSPASLVDHIANTANPHAVTAAQAGAAVNNHTHKTRSLILFGYKDEITAAEETVVEWARTVDGIGNEYGYRMLRAGKVTGISCVYSCINVGGESTLTIEICKNGIATDVKLTGAVTSTGNGLGVYKLDNSFSFEASDVISAKITLYNDVGGVRVSCFSIVAEIEFESDTETA